MQKVTLDIDHNRKDTLDKTIKKIGRCSFLNALHSSPSASTNGYHLTLWCQIKCPKCRMAFDDQVRYYRDLTLRQPSERNVLFKTYTVTKAGKHITL